MERIEPVAYRLSLPASLRIHLVFHVSLLKLHKGSLPSTPVTLPATSTDNHPLVAPLAILDWRLDHAVSPPVQQVLVQWEGHAPEDSTWECWEELRRVHNLEDKVVFGDGSVDSNTQQSNTQTGDNAENSRPKRVRTRPTYLRDYA